MKTVSNGAIIIETTKNGVIVSEARHHRGEMLCYGSSFVFTEYQDLFDHLKNRINGDES